MQLRRFDYDIGGNKKKKALIASSVLVLTLLVGVTVYSTFAKYKVTKTYNILEGRVANFKRPDLSIKIVAIDSNGKESLLDEIPKGTNYSYNERSHCEKGSNLSFDENKRAVTISSNNKDNCTIYFDGEPSLNDTLLKSAKDLKYLNNAYYFSGEVTNNYLSINNILWRITKINEDGTIKIIAEENISEIDYANISNINSNLNEWFNNNLGDYQNQLLFDTIGILNLEDTKEIDLKYLNNGKTAWVLPIEEKSYLNSDGKINKESENKTHGVRPTINMKAYLKVNGEGTKDNPYKLV